MPHGNWQLCYAQLQLTTFVWTIAIDNYCIDYHKWQLVHAAEQH